MNNKISTDLFNDYQVPTFETGTGVPAQAESTAVSESSFPYGIVITVIIAAVILFTIVKKLLSKPSNNEYIQEEVTQRVEPEKKPQAVEIKRRNEKSNFATPTNLNKCIRGFLENTRTK